MEYLESKLHENNDLDQLRLIELHEKQNRYRFKNEFYIKNGIKDNLRGSSFLHFMYEN